MTKEVKIKDVTIGGGKPVAVQSMTTTTTSDIDATIKQIMALKNVGCDIVRVAVNGIKDAEAIKEITKQISLPLVADIHFDYRLALAAVENGANKIRINPGNIGGKQKTEMVVSACRERNVPIRVGVNGGSLDSELEQKYGRTHIALAESCLRSVAIVEDCGYDNLVLSVKSSDVATTTQAYRYLSERTSYPLHVGVTEAGTYEQSIVKSSIGIGSLLLGGIGDTIRVSITGEPTREIIAAKRILRAVGLDKNYVEIVSCPTCGRCHIDVENIARRVEEKTSHLAKRLKIAVMGCVVNGVGEGKDADVGLAGGDGKAIIFENGEVVHSGTEENMVKKLLEIIEQRCASAEEK